MRWSTPRHRPSRLITAAILAGADTIEHASLVDDEGIALAPGRYGDVIAVRCKPLADIACLQRVEVVVKGGLRFK